VTLLSLASLSTLLPPPPSRSLESISSITCTDPPTKHPLNHPLKHSATTRKQATRGETIVGRARRLSRVLLELLIPATHRTRTPRTRTQGTRTLGTRTLGTRTLGTKIQERNALKAANIIPNNEDPGTKRPKKNEGQRQNALNRGPESRNKTPKTRASTPLTRACL